MNINNHYPFKPSPLPYDYDALEPYIDTETMHYHHDKHYVTYVNNLNETLKNNDILKRYTLKQLLLNLNSFPDNVKIPVQNNAGGVFNHELYFNCMKRPITDNKPPRYLYEKIINSFKSFERFKELFFENSKSLFGSGYTWLVSERNGKLKILNTPNQNTALSKSIYPILLIDVWEHAYYLKYKNERDRYIRNWFNLIDWNWIEKNYKNYINEPK